MNEQDSRRFAGRDWTLVEEAKRRFWVERALSSAAAAAPADSRRRHVAIRSDWPSAAERAEDIDAPARVSANLRSVR